MKKVFIFYMVLFICSYIEGQNPSREFVVGNEQIGSNVFCANNRYSTSEDIYYPEEIGCAGTINKISFCWLSGSSYNYSIEVYLSMTDAGSKSLVYSGRLDHSGGDWHSINITPYYYNGVDPLVLTIVRDGVTFDNYSTYPSYASYRYQNRMSRRYMVGSKYWMGSGSFSGVNSNYIETSYYKPVIKINMTLDLYLYYTIKDSSNCQVGVSLRPKNNSVPVSINNDSVIAIPSIVTISGVDYNVGSIEDSCFAGKGFIQSVSLPSTLQNIGDYAFYGCTGLNGSMAFPSSLSSIGDYAFYGCTGLNGSMAFPSSLSSIGNYAFYGCIGLNGSIVFPSSLSSIGSYAYCGCTGISGLSIPEGVDSVKDGTFKDCTGLIGINLPNGLKYIGGHSFENDSNMIGELIIPNAVRTVGTYSFSHCKGFSSLKIGSSVDSIGSFSFLEMNGLSGHLILPHRLKTIGAGAFKNCSGINGKLSIPDSVVRIGSEAFYGCIGIDSLYVGVGITQIEGNAFRECGNVSYLYFNAKSCQSNSESYYYSNPIITGISTSVKKVVVGDSVTAIPHNAFSGYRNVDSLYIGVNVRTIGAYAFYGCDSVRYLFYNSKQSGISRSGSNNNSSTDYSGLFNTSTYDYRGRLNTLIVGDSVRAIPSWAFEGLRQLKNVTIGKNVEVIGHGTFSDCTNINNIYYNARSCSDDGFCDSNRLYSTNEYYKYQSQYKGFYSSRDSIRNVIIGDSVETIPSFFLFLCRNLSSINIPASVKRIGESAFESSGISCTLSLPLNVRFVGKRAFNNCDNLSGTISLSDAAYVGNFAFSDCDNILYLSTNNSSAAIGNSAFSGCDRLVSVNIGDSTSAIGDSAFAGCYRLSSVTVGKSVSSIGNSAFSGCVRMVMPILPEGLQSIGNSAFNGCSYVEGELVFPSTLTDIGINSFAGCGDITQLTMKGANPPTIYGSTFQGLPTTTPVRVPCGSVLNYYVSDNWENFSDIAESSPFNIAVSANNGAMGDVVVSQAPTCTNHNTIITAVANPGYHFLHWNDGVNANPRQFAATKDTAFEAVFVVNNSYITVHSSDSSMGGVSGSGLYGYNAPVVLNAMANSNYHFLKWTDGNTTNPRYLMATQDSSFTAVFVSNISNIQVGSENPEMGTASGGGLCYYQNQISLSASPLYGYHFVSWNDGNTQNPRTVIVSQDSAFMAVFAVSNFSINVGGNNSSYGSVSGTGSYAYNTEMSMTATPAYGYHFEQWNDGNANNPRTITVTRDSMFVAQFAANVYQISVEANDPVMGSAFGGGNYNYNTQLTLTATPTYGYHFTQWSDGVTDNPRIVTVSTNANYTAQFEINSYSLTVNSSNPAIGTAAGGGSYNYLSPVNITAYPNIGYHFTQWSDGNTDNPRLVSVTQNATYTAQFAINTYAISATSSNSIRGMASGGGTYAHFAQDTLRATAFYGYHFTQWNDGNTDNPRIVVVTDVANYEAQFDPNNYQVIGNSTDLTIGVVSGSGSYPYQSQTALTAIAMDHYHFVQWTDSITDNPRTITVTRDTVLTAQFAIDQHQVMVLSSNTTMGTTSSTLNVNYGGATYISATPNYGYHFTQWSDGSTQNPRRVVVTQDTIFTAQFDYNNYSAQLNVNDTVMGSVAGTGTYQYLTNVTIEAIANYGYHFSQWSDGNNDNPRQIQLTRDTILTAQFSVNQYSVVLYSSDSLHGSVVGGGDYDYLSQVTLTATPVAHYHFVQWSDGNTSNPRVLTVVADVEYTATFEEDEKFEVVVMANDSTRGSTTAGGMYYAGDQITIRATANDHYYFSEWSDGNSANPRVVTVVGNATYMANFIPNPYVVTLAVNDNSMGNVAGGGTYDYGSEVSISATAYPGYHFARWHDGDTANPRTIRVEDNCYYQAIFEADNTEGISDIEYDYSVRTANMQIMVDGVMGRKVEVYDISGRRIAYIDKSGDKMIANVPARGVYLVKVGETPARKVVVM